MSAPTRDELAEDVRWFFGSLVGALFGRLAYDQVAYREIAAAVDRTGRFAENFTDRGVRSGAYALMMIFGDRADAQEQIDRLKTMHRDVRGSGTGAFADVRYSALDPDLWKWVAVSGLNVAYQGYIHTAGHRLDDAGKDVVYRTLRDLTAPLELPSRATALPATRVEMAEYYDSVAANTLADNEFLRFARDSLTALPMPTLLVPRRWRRAVRPLWNALIPYATRPVVICSSGAAHPKMRELLGVRWGAPQRLEFRVYTALARAAWQHLPRRLTLDPLAYNRYRYERLRAAYERMRLETFAAS